MGGVFGKSKKSASRVTEHDKAVLVEFSAFRQSLSINFIGFDFLSPPANEATER